jgi:Family of unknown function (DUF5947)
MTSITHNGSGASREPAASARPAGGPRGLRRFATTAPRPRVDREERCGLCGEVIGPRHRHLVETEHRAIVCACTACALLFTYEGVVGGRYRAIPSRVCHDPSAPLTDAEWAELAIPVAIAFFFFNSALERVVASYPSPAGVTECELDLSAWERLAQTHPLLRALAPDVEALLVIRGQPGTSDDRGIETFLIPVDECYALAGQLRLTWQGFDGGAEAHAAISEFLSGLRERAVQLGPPAQLEEKD